MLNLSKALTEQLDQMATSDAAGNGRERARRRVTPKVERRLAHNPRCPKARKSHKLSGANSADDLSVGQRVEGSEAHDPGGVVRRREPILVMCMLCSGSAVFGWRTWRSECVR